MPKSSGIVEWCPHCQKETEQVLSYNDDTFEIALVCLVCETAWEVDPDEIDDIEEDDKKN